MTEAKSPEPSRDDAPHNNLGEFRKEYYSASKQASDNSRHLALAGLATVWIFKKDTPSGILVPDAMYLPALMFVTALLLDFLQYSSKALIWGWWTRSEEKRGRATEYAPRWFNWPAIAFFWVKQVVVGFGYVFILHYLSGTIHLAS